MSQETKARLLFDRRVWTLLGLTVAAGIAWMVFAVVRFITDSNNSSIYSDAGQFFSFAYGLPLGLAGAGLGAAATAIAGRIANKQGDIQLLQLAVEQTERSIVLFKQLTAAIGDTIRIGNDARDLGDRLVKAITEEQKHDGRSQTRECLEALAPALRSEEAIIEFLSEIESPERRALITWAALTLWQFRAVVARFADVFDGITDSVFVSHFSRIHLRELPDHHRPLVALSRLLPKSVIENTTYFSEAIAEISLNITSLAQSVEAADLAVTSLQLPQDNYTIDFLGYVLLPLRLRLRRLRQYGDKTIGGYCVNLGAAYFLTAAQYIPNKDILIDQFESLFAARSDAVTAFLKDTYPGRYDFGPRIILESLEVCLHNPHRLILVEVYEGGKFHQEFYDPDQHGPIPAHGYANDADWTEEV